MRVLPPLTITEAMLTSTTVPEAAPAAYSSGTTYAVGDQVSVASGLVRTVYQSLQSANTGHDPATSPTWWRLLGTTYAAYAPGTTYAAGDVVVDATAHLEYVSQQGSNTGHTPATDDGTWWVSRPSNRWRMFDLLRNTGSTAPGPVTVVLTPGRRVDAIGLVGLVADKVTINVTVDGVTVYSVTENLNARDTTGWYEYFFGDFIYRSAVAKFDLPPYVDGIVSVTMSRENGDVTCGGLILGTSVYLGGTRYSAESDAINFSTVNRDDFGNATLVQRRSVPKTNQTVVCPRTNVNKVIAARKDLNAVPALWSGLDDAASAYFEPLLILGFYRTFTVTMSGPDTADISLELEEV